MSLKMLDGNDLPHELSLTTREKTRLRNGFNNNMSTDIKLTKAQISKIIQSEEFLGSLLCKLVSPLMKVAVPLVKNYFSSIRNYSCCFSNWCRNSKKIKIHGSATATLIISNEERNEIMKIVQPLEDCNFYWKKLLKQLKWNKTTKSGIFKHVIRYSRC